MKEPSNRRDLGGPLNLTGIHYQLLSSFLEMACAVRVIDPKKAGGRLTSVTLVIEPRGGGDSAVLQGSSRRVQQIKTRQGSWRFSQLTAKVLPDLFRAYLNDPALAGVEFVTNGELDEKARGFREALVQLVTRRKESESNLEQLAGGEEIPLSWFSGKTQTTRGSTATLRDLIDYLAERLRTEAIEGPHATTHRESVKTFLSRLSLRAGLSFEAQEGACRQFLQGWGIAPEALRGAINRAVGYLLSQGSHGNRAVTFDDLVRELGLAQRDLNDWDCLITRGRELLLADLARPRPGYDNEQDVRQFDPLTDGLLRWIFPQAADQSGSPLGSRGRSSYPIEPIVVWGKSGIGKTWLLARAAGHLARATVPKAPVVLWIPSRQDPEEDLNRAALAFCQRVWGREHAPSMELLSEWVAQSVESPPGRWLVVFIDNVKTLDYLDRLGELRHGDLGVALVVALTAELRGGLPERPGLRLLKAPGFDSAEVLRFLERCGSGSWRVPPADVRKLLETPVFCALYAAVKQDGATWQPEDEYALVQRFWLARIAQPRPQAADALAQVSLARLQSAAATIERTIEGSYSWALDELTTAGLSQADLEALEVMAILVQDNWSRGYSFGLERVLQWAAAEGALRAFQAGRMQAEELAALATGILTSESQARWTFSYVPADLLWLLLAPDLPGSCRSAAEAILGGLESHHDFFRLQNWLSTLGQRVVPLIFSRLRSAGADNTTARYTYRDALRKVPAVEVLQLATELLGETSLELQSVGVLLLREREYPFAMDALWALYRKWWADSHAEKPSEAERREGPSGYHLGIGEKALRRSVRNRPEWLERQLLDSESLEGPNSTLLFLLASTPKSEAVWRRFKELLRSRLVEDRQRGFARCIVSFHDQAEIPWLESRVNETRDSLGGEARRALALLSPEKALAPIHPQAVFELSWTRGWWFPLALIQRREEAVRFLQKTILDSEDPLKTAFFFSGYELLYPATVLDFLLGTTRAALAELKQGKLDSGKDPLFAPLSRLLACQTLNQLDALWDTQHAQLESEVADWLSGCNPNDSGYVRRNSEEKASELLRLMSGPGLARVGARFLERAATWLGGRDGLDLAVREPNQQALESIRRRALDPPPSAPPATTEHPILQRSCVTALAYLRDFEGFARGVVQWGLQLPPDIGAYLDGHREAPEFLAVARATLEEKPIPAGAFMLLGLHGGPEALGLLRGNRRLALGSSELELAWILGLDYTMDCSSETLDIFAEGLASTDDGIQFSSWRALLHRIEEPRAQELLVPLVDRDQKGFEQLGRVLLDTELRTPVAERLWRVAGFGSSSARKIDLVLYQYQLEHFAVLGTEEVKAFLLEQATGAKRFMAAAARYSAIRGVASFDRDAALRATLACREEERSSKNREWPALLLEIGGLEGLSHLAVELAESRDLVWLHAVGEALRAAKQLPTLMGWLRDEDPRIREGACYATCAQAFTPELEENVIRCCLDPEEDVRNAAQAAFDRLWRDQEVARLITRFHSEPRSGRRWALIDSSLAIGYPGVQSGFGQISWFSELLRDRPYYEVQYAVERLKERRKKLVDELERKSKDFREDA